VRKLLAALLFVGAAARASAGDDPRAVIAKAIAAQGGESKLAAVRAGRSTLRGTLFDGNRQIAFTSEQSFQLPGQIKIALTLKTAPKTTTIIEVINGDEGWISIDGQVKEVDSVSLARARQLLYLSRITRLTPLLRDKEFELTGSGESRINDRPAACVKVASKGQKDVGLYFDKETGLLVKLEYPTTNNQDRGVTQEDILSDYAEFGGVKLPKKNVSFQDGMKLVDVEIVDAKFPDSIPSGEFGKP
jgi:hypothetical protein